MGVPAPIICDASAESARHWVIRKGDPPELRPGRRAVSHCYHPPGRSPVPL